MQGRAPNVRTYRKNPSVWTRCLCHQACGLFPENSRSKWLLWLRRLPQTLRPDLGPRHFSSKYSHQMALVTCHVHFNCAGTHKLRIAILGPVIFAVNSRVRSVLWHVQLHFDCAGSHKLCVAISCPGIFPENGAWNCLVTCHVHESFDCAGLRKLCVVSWGSGTFL